MSSSSSQLPCSSIDTRKFSDSNSSIIDLLTTCYGDYSEGYPTVTSLYFSPNVGDGGSTFAPMRVDHVAENSDGMWIFTRGGGIYKNSGGSSRFQLTNASEVGDTNVVVPDMAQCEYLCGALNCAWISDMKIGETAYAICLDGRLFETDANGMFQPAGTLNIVPPPGSPPTLKMNLGTTTFAWLPSWREENRRSRGRGGSGRTTTGPTPKPKTGQKQKSPLIWSQPEAPSVPKGKPLGMWAKKLDNRRVRPGVMKILEVFEDGSSEPVEDDAYSSTWKTYPASVSIEALFQKRFLRDVVLGSKFFWSYDKKKLLPIDRNIKIAPRSIRLWATKNPNISMDILSKLVTDEEDEVRIRVVYHMKTTPAMMAALSKDSSEEVLLGVANSRRTPAGVLDVMAGYPYQSVRLGVVNNEETSSGTLEKLSLRNPELNGLVVQHGNVLPSTLDRIARSVSVPQESERLLSLIAHSPKSDEPTLRFIHGKAGHLYGVASSLAVNWNTPQDVLQALSGYQNYSVRLGVAQNTRAESAVLDLLADDALQEVRKTVAKSKNASGAALAKLARNADPVVAFMAQENENFRPDVPMAQDGRIVHVLPEYKAEGLPVELGLCTSNAQGRLFSTGKKVTFRFIRSTQKAPYLGSKYGQDIEPAGRYMVHNEDPGRLAPRWEEGIFTFSCPLVLEMVSSKAGEPYGPSGWKARLRDVFGKTGKELSCHLKRLGFDGIVTCDSGMSTREIVDLTGIQCDDPR